MNKDERYMYCARRITSIQNDYAMLNEERRQAHKYYRGDSDIVEVIKDRSKATTTDLMDTIEWAMPAILESLAGSDNFIRIEPVSEEDSVAADYQNLLVEHQLRERNNWYLICHDWIKDALLMKIGAIKYQWVVKDERIPKEYEGLTEMEYREIASRPDVEVVEVEEKIITEEQVEPETGALIQPRESVYRLKVNYVVHDEYPKLEVVPPEDFGINIDAKSVDEAEFVFHRSRLKKWQVEELYGKGVLENLQPGNDLSGLLKMLGVEQSRLEDLAPFHDFWDKDTESYIVYECYYRDDDGTPRITTICGNVVLLDEENKYRRPPFACITPVKMSHRLLGMSIYDLLKQIQSLRTVLLRQIVDNLYQSNFRRYFVDPERVNLQDYLNTNVTNAAIRTKGDPRVAVMPEMKAPLPAEVFQFWELLQLERDYHSGVPRSYQGVIPSVIHRTARGLNQQFQLASQRIQSLTRLIAEMGLKDLIKSMIDMNIMFMTKKTSLRHLNKWVEITPDNIIGRFDIKITVGLGVPSKENIIVQCQQLLGIYAQLFRAGIPVVNAQNVFNLMKQMLDAMGLKNSGDFITDPKVVERLSQIYLLLMQLAGNNPQIMQPVAETMLLMGVPVKELQAQVASAMTPEQTGSEAPTQAAQPIQPHAPRTTPQGRGFYP